MIDVTTLRDEYSTKSVRLHEYEAKSDDSRKMNLKLFGILPPFLLTPTVAFAESGADATFRNIYDAVMKMFDGATVLIIIFAGASWMLGHRSRAIEMLIGASCGYLLARHAIDIRDFLRTI